MDEENKPEIMFIKKYFNYSLIRKCFKCLNVLLILGSFIIIAGSFILYTNVQNKKKILEAIKKEDIMKYFEYFLIAMFVYGSLLCLIPFCGCCEPFARSKCFLISYALIMILFISTNVCILVSKNKYIGEASALLEKEIDNIFRTSRNPKSDPVLHGIQYIIKCCGPDGPSFYKLKFNIAGVKIKLAHIPSLAAVLSPSCCSRFDPKDHKRAKNKAIYTASLFAKCSKHDIYQNGCTKKALRQLDIFVNYSRYATYVLSFTTAVEVITMLLAVYMCFHIWKEQREGRRETSTEIEGVNIKDLTSIIPKVGKDGGNNNAMSDTK